MPTRLISGIDFSQLRGSKDLVSDFGASPSAADNSQAFMVFNAWARTESLAGRRVELSVPPGTYQFDHLACRGALAGIKKLRIIGYAATFQNTSVSYNLPWFAAASANSLFLAGKPINTTAVGDATVTCVTPSDAGMFVVGEWIIISSLDIQPFNSQYGFPPNLDYFEYTQVISVDAGTGVVGVAPAVRHMHRSDFPDTRGDYGKARIQRMNSQDGEWPWDVDHVYEGITVLPTASVYTTIQGQRIRFKDCTIPGISPTMAGSVEFYDSVITGYGEPDKLVEQLIFRNGTLKAGMGFQSSSINKVSWRGTRIMGRFGVGVVKWAEVRDCDVDLLLDGGGIYGMNRTCILADSIIHRVFAPIGALLVVGQSTYLYSPYVTYANGTFTVQRDFPGGVGPSGYTGGFYWNTVPGAMVYFEMTGGHLPSNIGVGIVTGLRYDATYRYIDTTLSHAALPSWASGNIRFQRSGSLTVENCSGADSIVSASEAQRKGKAPWEYKRAMLAGKSATSGNFGSVSGELERIRVNVIRATSIANSRIVVTNFGNRTASALDDAQNYTITIDITVAGIRDFTKAVLSGAQTNDSVKLGVATQSVLPANRWWLNIINWSYTIYNPASLQDYQAAIIEIEMEFDTGLFRRRLPSRKDGAGNLICGINGSLP